MQQEEEPDLIKELYDHQDDPDEWSEESIPIEVRPAKTAVISCRLPLEDFHALIEAMTSAGESLSEYVRKAVVQRLHNDALNGAKTSISYGAPEKDDAWQNWSTTAASTELRPAS